MKKINFIIIFALITSLFSSCSSGMEGFDEIKKARELYAGLSSAYVTVTELETNEVIQQFAFRFEGDLLTYYYMGKNGKDIYYEYHNGIMLSYGSFGDDGWTEVNTGAENYYSFNKTKRHPNADRGMIFFEPQSIVSTKVQTWKGALQVDCRYDVEKLGKTVKEQFTDYGELTDFTVKVVINNDGYAERVQQEAVIDGKIMNYQIDIKNMNNVPEIERHDFPKKR